jgi:TPR repeat protein
VPAKTSVAGLRPRAIRMMGRSIGAALLFAASACASSSFIGMSLIPGRAAPELRELARRAMAGDKQAQLDLGIRFEEGDGVPVNRKRARRLYRMAASDGGGPAWVYVPSVIEGRPGRVMQLGEGSRQAGLAQAKLRLEALDD